MESANEEPKNQTEEKQEANHSDEPTSSRDRDSVGSVMDHISRDKTGFVMFCSRMVQIIAAISYLLPILMPARLSYVVALVAAMVTSCLRLRQRLPRPELSRQFAAAAVMEDASHYVMYGLMFTVPPPLTIVLLPVTLFAVLHSASYLRSLLDVTGADSGAAARRLVALVERHSQNILRMIAVTEIMLLPYTVVMLLAGRGSLLVPFLYYRFLTLRYASRRNPYSRAVFAELRAALEAQAAGPRCPAPLAAAIRRGVALVSSFAPPMVPAQ